MADLYKKKVLRVESASKNGRTWKVAILEGKEPGTESKQNIFDSEVAAKIIGPGDYMIRFVKNGQFWNIADVVSGPAGGGAAPQGGVVSGPAGGGAAPQCDALLTACIVAVGSVYSGAWVENQPIQRQNIEASVVAMVKTLHDEMKKILNPKPEPVNEPAIQES